MSVPFGETVPAHLCQTSYQRHNMMLERSTYQKLNTARIFNQADHTDKRKHPPGERIFFDAKNTNDRLMKGKLTQKTITGMRLSCRVNCA